MPDNEIIKALEDLIRKESRGYEAVLAAGGRRDESQELFIEMMESIIAMLNRQKAEIERLTNEVDKVNHDYILLCSDIAQNRAEAIKEFAERFAEEWSFYFPEKPT